MAFLVSLRVEAPDTIKSEIHSSISRELATLGDVALTSEVNSEYEIAVYAVEAESRYHLAVLISRTAWKDVEFWVRRALLDMWDRMADKLEVSLTERGVATNSIVGQLGTDNSIKSPKDHWPMVVGSERLAEAGKRIVSYFDSKFLEIARQKPRPAPKAEPAAAQPTAVTPQSMAAQAGQSFIEPQLPAGETVQPSQLPAGEAQELEQQFRHVIKAKDIIADIRARMTEADLLEKYGVSSKGLQNAFRQLVLARAITAHELTAVCGLPYESQEPENLRQAPRYYLDFELPIHELEHPDTKGMVRDLAAEGVGIIGIEAEVDETKTFVILGDEFGAVDPFQFEAQCRWISRQDPDGDLMSGFRITNISEEHKKTLSQLIRIVTVEDQEPDE